MLLYGKMFYYFSASVLIYIFTKVMSLFHFLSVPCEDGMSTCKSVLQQSLFMFVSCELHRTEHV